MGTQQHPALGSRALHQLGLSGSVTAHANGPCSCPCALLLEAAWCWQDSALPQPCTGSILSPLGSPKLSLCCD